MIRWLDHWMLRGFTVSLVAGCALAACSDGAGPANDAATNDLPANDAAADAPPPDTGHDAGGQDVQPADAPDSAAADTGADTGAEDVARDAPADTGTDTGAVDTGTDTGAVDTGAVDTGTVDAGADTGAADAGTDTGAADAGGDAGPGTPSRVRLVAPLTMATVTSRRPTLRWSLGAGATGARVELCRDRACGTVVATFDAPGNYGRPPGDLPTGVLFWRAHALAGTTPTGGPSTTWELVVGARSAPVDTSWGATPDVDGDGYADVLVSGSVLGMGREIVRVSVYRGGATGLPATPTAHREVDGGGNLGGFVASAGDVNGDGYTDVMVPALSFPTSAHVPVFLGGPAGLGATPGVTLPRPTGAGFSRFAYSGAGVGDVDGDGYGDVLVSAPDNADGTGLVLLYRGGPAGLATTPAATLASPEPNGQFGLSVAGAGDVNGDGYADVIVGARALAESAGRAYVYHGGASGLATTPARTLNGPDGRLAQFGHAVAGAGDVNGDGYADVVVGMNGAGTVRPGRAYVFHGSATGVAATAAATLAGTDAADRLIGTAVASAGDLNGDGYADVVMGTDNASRSYYTGHAYVYLGRAAGVSGAASVTLTGPMADRGTFGNAVAGAGDVNRDGFGDLIVSVTHQGRVQVFGGLSTGLGASPVATLQGAGSDYNFGATVASHTPRRGPARAHGRTLLACRVQR